MNISLHNLVPGYLPDDVIEASGVWNQEHELKRGERIGVCGPSGRGKSTLMKILCGLQRDYAGTLFYGGEAMDQQGIGTWPGLRKGHISTVLQDFFLFEDANGYVNLDLLPVLAPDVTRDRVEDWVQRLGLIDLMKREVATWSQGQKQRLALLRALAAPSDWLLLDEPFSHLDSGTQQVTAALISEVCDERGSGWVVSHLEAEPEIACDRGLKV